MPSPALGVSRLCKRCGIAARPGRNDRLVTLDVVSHSLGVGEEHGPVLVVVTCVTANFLKTIGKVTVFVVVTVVRGSDVVTVLVLVEAGEVTVA